MASEQVQQLQRHCREEVKASVSIIADNVGEAVCRKELYLLDQMFSVH